MLTCLFQLQKIFLLLLFLICPSVAGLPFWRQPGPSSIPSSKAPVTFAVWGDVGNGWILEEIPVPLCVHDTHIPLYVPLVYRILN